MGVTLADLAAATGYSTATVSRALSGKETVSPQTRKAVMDAVKQLQYTYRGRAKSIAKSNMVLVIAGQLSNPITVAYSEGIRETLSPLGYNVLISVTNYSEAEDVHFLEYARDMKADGVFFLNVAETKQLTDCLKTISSPVIFVNRWLRSVDADSVTVDNYRCGYIATEYLILNGHRRIAHLAGPEDSLTCRSRNEGFLGAMQRYGLPIGENSIYYGKRDYESGYDYGHVVAEMPPAKRFTGVYCTNGMMALGFCESLRTCGLSVPDDVSVICSDNPQVFYGRRKQLSTVEYKPHEMGVQAAKLFLERLQHPEQMPKHIFYAPSLMINDSVKTIGAEPAPME